MASAAEAASGRLTIEVEGADVQAVAGQLPRAESLAPGTHLVAFAGKSRGWLGKILSPRDAPPLAAIGSALLARGYVNLGAGLEGGRAAAWGDSGDGVDVSGERPRELHGTEPADPARGRDREQDEG